MLDIGFKLEGVEVYNTFGSAERYRLEKLIGGQCIWGFLASKKWRLLVSLEVSIQT